VIDVQDLINNRPEFKDVHPERLWTAIQKADRQVQKANWTHPDMKPDAVEALAAHFLACRWESMARASGVATALANGQPSTATPIESDLKTTPYGAEYERLLDSYAIGTGFVL
jgi:hypothetical protein